MPTFLQRYLAGECEQVWAELLSASDTVREEPLYRDALAVARETMRRARYNIELLVSRLGKQGFVFGSDPSDESTHQAHRSDWDEEQPVIFAPPKPDVQWRIAQIERVAGALPLSVRAWYEHIGSVNFVGVFPVQDPHDPEGFNNWTQFAATFPEDAWMDAGSVDASEVWTCEHDLDPLYVNPIEIASADLTQVESTAPLEIAPDEHFKYGLSGGGFYLINLPNPAVDAPLEGEWHNTTFVNYLRICFRWGGFPGLECKAHLLEEELAFLTDSLLPI